MRFHAKQIRILPLAYAGADSDGQAGAKTVKPDDYSVIKIMGLLCGDTMVNGVMQSSIDIYMINEYRWCNVPGTFGPYQEFVDLAKGVPIVMALGEFGCDESPPRFWTMVPSFPTRRRHWALRMFFPAGGGLEVIGKRGTIPTADCKSLVTQFKAAKISTEFGTPDSICSWTPLGPSTGKNPIVARTGTMVSHMRRHGHHDHVIRKVDHQHPPRANLTTEESICGKPIVLPSGCGTCKSNADCGSHGQCSVVGDVGKNGSTCQCIGCWSGVSCSLYSKKKCNTLTSNPTVPRIVFTAVAAGLGLVTLVFCGLGIAATKEIKKLRQAEERTKRHV
ncbi:Aste57867_557 [Aphanomyces stellatus]|uniref:Aste57867_557 protein n=1 Tax=Aphanomyces stellatus TaxID=120398 RepID=A0A485K439_9STRA|nr:hypothetical protein As57867_000556 [Aphanomyces stellatus]VFT77782.1 Aste57867_557 [Aphanomyces stellatus]